MFSESPFHRHTALAIVLLLAGCSTPGKDVAFKETITVTSGEDDPRQQGSTIGTPLQQERPDDRTKTEYIEGTGQFVKKVKPVPFINKSGNGGLALNFRNTDIRIVIKAILGDTLNLSYTIDPRVTGNVTLETSGPISRDAMRVTLEALLKTKGYALVETSEGALVLPVSDAPQRAGAIRHGLPASVNLPGFGVHVVPLQYTLPSEMQQIIEPFSPQGGVLRVDDQRGLLVLAGTMQEITSMIQAVETFDVNQMVGMSFAIYSLRYGEPEKIVEELQQIFGVNDDTGSIVRYIPVPRINKVIAVAPSKNLLLDVEQWIGRLDIGESSPGRRIYVYHIKNGRASDLAQTLNQILGTQGGNFGRGLNGNRFNNQRNQNGLQTNRAQSRPFQNDPFGGAGNLGNNAFGNQGNLSQSGVRIVPSEESNSLVIMATPSEFGVVETALRQLDLPPRQVLIEVTLAEVLLTDELRFGLQWSFEFGDNSVAFGQSTSPSQQFPGFSWLHTNSSSASAVLNAIESITDVKVISSPKLLVLNNEAATLQVGDEVPVPTASAVSSNDSNAPIVNSIQYRSTGIILNVTPRINEGGLVMLDIDQEMSDVVETASSGIDAPTIQQRRMSSSIAVQNGSTIALGGLIRSTASRVNSGVPILQSIPILGHAFKSTDLVERRTELVVLLTPRIIRDVEETRNVMDYLKREFRSLLGPDMTIDDGPGN